MRALSANMLWLCIDECSQSQCIGTMYSIMREDSIVFEDFDQLILRADGMFDEIGYPQSFQQIRSMQDTQRKRYERTTVPLLSSEQVRIHHGKKNTYIVLVKARQHANWQGTLYTKEFQVIIEFQDILQLLNTIMDM